MLALGIALATIAAVVVSSVFYSLAPAAQLEGLASRPRVWQIGLEVLRSGIVACLVAGLMVAANWAGPAQGTILGLSLSILPIVLVAGSVQWKTRRRSHG